MMRAHAKGDGPLKALVRMVARLIDDVNKRRCDTVQSRRIDTMTGGAIRLKSPLPDLRVLRQGVRQVDVQDWGGVSRRNRSVGAGVPPKRRKSEPDAQRDDDHTGTYYELYQYHSLSDVL